MNIRNFFHLNLILLFSFISLSACSQTSNKELAIAFLKSMREGKNSAACKQFDSAVSSKINEASLGKIWESIESTSGKYIKTDSIFTLTSKGSEIIVQTCRFQNSNLNLRLTFNSEHKISGIFFTPGESKSSYKNPPYALENNIIEQKMELVNGKYRLPAILTLPKNVVKPPLIILVHGSGPNDMDETIGPNKIFKDLALGLATKGIATFRYDKRTKIYGSEIIKDTVNFTVKQETIEDASEAVMIAKIFKEIDTAKIYLLGHSLGANQMPAILAISPAAKGAILMSGNARPMEDLILEQYIYLDSLNSSPESKAEVEKIGEKVSLVKSSKLSLKTPASDLPLGVPAGYWMDLKNYRPVETAMKLNQRLFIMQGERDYQVTMQDYKLWQNSLSGKSNVKFKSYPALNHLYQEGSGKSNPNEYKTATHVPEYIIDDIVNWVNLIQH